MKNKRGLSQTAWIIIAIVVIAIIVGAYMYFGGGAEAVSTAPSAAPSVPQPPALPS